MKILLHYFLRIQKINALISLLLGSTGLLVSGVETKGLISWVMFLFATVGSFLSIALFETNHKDEYIYYFNRGWTKLHLIGGLWIFNISLFVFLKIILAFI